MLSKPLDELNKRRMLCQIIIKIIDQMDDLRKADAMEHYKAQLAEIDAKIAKITGKPPPVVVGLKTAKLFGKSEISK